MIGIPDRSFRTFHIIFLHADFLPMRTAVLAIGVLLAAGVFLLITCTDSSDADPAVVDSDDCGDYLTWTLFDNGHLEITGTGKMWKYTFTDDIWHGHKSEIVSVSVGDGVESIGDYAFYQCSALTSVDLPDSLKTICDYAFSDCDSLVSVSFPEGIKEIHNGAFKGCTSLVSVTLPDSVTGIYSYTFRSCTALEEIDMGSSVGWVGNGAFTDCSSLRTVHLPDSLGTLNDHFCGCTSLESVTVGEGNTSFAAVDGILYSKDLKTLVVYPAGRTDAYFAIPYHVTGIGYEAFTECPSLTAVRLTKPLSFSSFSFVDCTSLDTVYVPCDGSVSITAGSDDCGSIAKYASAVVTAHDYVTVFSWAEDGSSCSVDLTCPHNPSHTDVADAVVTSVVKTEPTEITKGVTEYTATFVSGGITYTDKMELEDIPVVVPDTPVLVWVAVAVVVAAVLGAAAYFIILRKGSA